VKRNVAMNLNKDRIIKDVHRISELNSAKSARCVETTLEIIKKTLESNEDVLISGFGKFFIKDNTKPRGLSCIRNNAYIPGAQKVVSFRCSPVLEKKINKKK
jgi:integration host factor subunit alpha